MKALRSIPCSPALATFLSCVGLVFLAGCSGQSEEMSKQLASLQKEVGRLRSSSLALQDLVDLLEERRGGAIEDAAVEEVETGDDRPVLEVVRLAPQASLAEPAPVIMTPKGDPNAPRPVIAGDARGVERIDDEAKKKASPAKPGAWRKQR